MCPCNTRTSHETFARRWPQADFPRAGHITSTCRTPWPVASRAIVPDFVRVDCAGRAERAHLMSCVQLFSPDMHTHSRKLPSFSENGHLRVFPWSRPVSIYGSTFQHITTGEQGAATNDFQARAVMQFTLSLRCFDNIVITQFTNNVARATCASLTARAEAHTRFI